MSAFLAASRSALAGSCRSAARPLVSGHSSAGMAPYALLLRPPTTMAPASPFSTLLGSGGCGAPAATALSQLWAASAAGAPARSPCGQGLPAAARLAAPVGARFMSKFGSEYQPSVIRRKRKWGFLARAKSKAGRKILVRRALKGRKFLSH